MQRSADPEIMDDLEFEGEVLGRTLDEIEFINKWLGGNAVTLDAVKKVVKARQLQKTDVPITISDLGCGGGEMLSLIYKWAESEDIKVKLTGIDANDYVVNHAAKKVPLQDCISFKKYNVLDIAFKKESFDISTCTLFCHHFENDVLINFLKQLKSQTRFAIIINDIHRHWFAYYSIKYLTSLFSRSYMVKYDAQLSVLRAFKKSELELIISKAGFSRFEIRWKWAFRFQVILWCD
ncbi:2-polyprenyl-3-methyl-5-hydroxy-6-metoxy-1,4-benzoquinol methylase [Sporocytophaga myxococcoides]|uniref:2-polyprenyl-3-methyl-5-hydroxy-6-metoxy-1,4-benzoquinol methylase n=1 Tax=Sporocytophaga myxococcoides TaxID=153721 RepID=A0A098LM37_9BACT|nr:2-polyprenyl-3-methyl-5-hydroxy-6-metoxy-1,4-benzoquinol methylase [Sporocytophaga myxococcoides]